MKIIGVSACPTGIAHTYMAQEALEKAAKAMGHECQIETQGSIGAENELSRKQVKEADVVILAVEVAIEGMDRFDDKVIYKANIAKCISQAEKIIEEALALVG
ncbi:PTS fructose transporter subunit IIB [Tannockella kyphosi]|uniref:PTS fructose transporter subunit IIB n=1 Tax=Tannockella kyphosi TaxID=2899121 RepID=UPI002012D588|nr:PTS fructose transporter subunit IIB [Tannockella kyphosi]